MTDNTDDDEQIIQDAVAIGRAMLKVMRERGAEQNRHPFDLFGAAYQALIQVHHLLFEEAGAHTVTFRGVEYDLRQKQQ